MDTRFETHGPRKVLGDPQGVEQNSNSSRAQFEDLNSTTVLQYSIDDQ